MAARRVAFWLAAVALLLGTCCASAPPAAPVEQHVTPISPDPLSQPMEAIPTPAAAPMAMRMFTAPFAEYVVPEEMALYDPYRFAYAAAAAPQLAASAAAAAAASAPVPAGFAGLHVYGGLTPLREDVIPHAADMRRTFSLTPAMSSAQHAHQHAHEHAHKMRFKRPVSTAVFNTDLPSNQQHAATPVASHASVSSPSASSVSSPAAHQARPLPSNNADEEDASHLMRFLSTSESVSAAAFPWQEQVRASYEGRRRMVPYGGFDMTMNPYRRPNADRVGTIFFTPKMSNAGIMGPDDGLNIAAILNTQRLNLLSQLHQRIYGGVFGVGGPGWQHFSRLSRPYGINPYMGPFSYYTPPPFPPAGGFPPFAPPTGQAASPPTGSDGAASAAPPGTKGPAPGPAQAQQAAADAGAGQK